MGSGDGILRTWSGSGDSSHKEPLSGARSHQAHFMFDYEASCPPEALFM